MFPLENFNLKFETTNKIMAYFILYFVSGVYSISLEMFFFSCSISNTKYTIYMQYILAHDKTL